MPLYFVDTSDGEQTLIDDEGFTASNRDEARGAALAALPGMARDVMPDGDHRQFVVRIRNQDDVVIYVAIMSLAGGWCAPGQDPAEKFFEGSGTN